mmetsp:Transcript_6447/g.28376  ORF Transcript_6447/g.28376 Transcript_6447/m.28376 type:complete len:653 (-) Transcript_6447:174-2132(-)
MREDAEDGVDVRVSRRGGRGALEELEHRRGGIHAARSEGRRVLRLQRPEPRLVPKPRAHVTDGFVLVQLVGVADAQGQKNLEVVRVRLVRLGHRGDSLAIVVVLGVNRAEQAPAFDELGIRADSRLEGERRLAENTPSEQIPANLERVLTPEVRVGIRELVVRALGVSKRRALRLDLVPDVFQRPVGVTPLHLLKLSRPFLGHVRELVRPPLRRVPAALRDGGLVPLELTRPISRGSPGGGKLSRPVAAAPRPRKLLAPSLTRRDPSTRGHLHDVVPLHHRLPAAHPGHELEELRVLKLRILVARHRLGDSARVRRSLRLRLRRRVRPFGAGRASLVPLVLLPPELARPLPAGHRRVELLRPRVRGRVGAAVRRRRRDLAADFVHPRRRSLTAVFLGPLHGVRPGVARSSREGHRGEVIGPPRPALLLLLLLLRVLVMKRALVLEPWLLNLVVFASAKLVDPPRSRVRAGVRERRSVGVSPHRELPRPVHGALGRRVDPERRQGGSEPRAKGVLGRRAVDVPRHDRAPVADDGLLPRGQGEVTRRRGGGGRGRDGRIRHRGVKRGGERGMLRRDGGGHRRRGAQVSRGAGQVALGRAALLLELRRPSSLPRTAGRPAILPRERAETRVVSSQQVPSQPLLAEELVGESAGPG